MAYQIYKLGQGTFCIDWDVCMQIIRSYHRSRLQIDHGWTKTESTAPSSGWGRLNPLNFGLPDISYVEVDWDRVRRETNAAAFEDGHAKALRAALAPNGVDTLVSDLRQMQAATQWNVDTFRSWMRDVSQRSAAEIDRAVDTFETAADRARLVRDLSGSILIGVATVATGGAAAAAVAGGAGATAAGGGGIALSAGLLGTAVKTTARYQDTDSFGAASIEAAQNIVCTVIPVARGAQMAKVFKVLISTGADTSKALLAGDALDTALLVGAMNIPSALGGEATKRVLNPILSKAAVPVVTKVIEDRSRNLAQNMVRDAMNRPGGNAAPPAQDDRIRLANEVAFKDELLLKFAIVDMAKGVGRSWW